MHRLIFYRITRWGYLGVLLSIWLTSLRTTEGLTVNAFIDSLRTPTSNQVSREILMQSQILDFYNLASSVWLFPIPGYWLVSIVSVTSLKLVITFVVCIITSVSWLEAWNKKTSLTWPLTWDYVCNLYN